MDNEAVLEFIAKQEAANQPAAPVAEAPAKPTEQPAPATEPVVPPADKPADTLKPAEPAPLDLKSIKLEDVLKAHGFDEKAHQFLGHVKNNTVDQWARSYTIDFNKLPDEEMLRRKVDADNSDMSEDERETLYEIQKEKYKLDPTTYSEDEVKRGLIALKADMKSFRKAEIEKQEQSRIPEMKATDDVHALQQKYISDYAEALKATDVYKDLKAKGVLAVGSGDHAFNMDVNADHAMSLITDDDAAAKSLSDDKGVPDARKQFLVAAFQSDPDGFIKKLIDHGMKLNEDGTRQKLGNEQPPASTQATKQDLTPAMIMAMETFGANKNRATA